MDGKVLDNGKAPILLEPVKASVTFAGRPLASVNLVDHSGRRIGRTLPLTRNRLTIDGTEDHTVYYEVVFQ